MKFLESRVASSALLVAVLVLLGACTGEEAQTLPPLEIPAGCNPLASEFDCMLPYPSNVFLVADESMPSGHIVQVPEHVLPQKDTGGGIDINQFFAVDGFSHLPTIMVVFPTTADLSFHEKLSGDLSLSLSDSSPTLLIDAESGERILHLAEADIRVNDGERQAFLIRPLTRLKNQTRYVVAIRAIQSSAGELMPVPEGFRRLRDKEAEGDPILEPLSQRYESQVFSVLADNNVPRSNLQLAWDFTTGSMERLTSDMVSIRTQLTAALEKTPPEVEVIEVENNVDESIGRKIVGHIKVPLFMDKEEAGASINRDEAGAIVQNGMATVPFTIIIPHSVIDRRTATPARLIQFGHGFFGDRSEIEGDFVRSFANQIGAVVVAVEWWGMDKTDRGFVADALYNQPSSLMHFSDRVHQGMANQIALSVAAGQTMTELDELKVGGELVYDPSHIYFYGISQGHILGGTLAAISPHFERITLSVGGAGLSYIMMRSYNFLLFLQLMNANVTDLLEQTKLIALTQQVADRFDPVTYAPWVLNSPLENTPQGRQILLQIGIGDSQVPNMASHIHARSLGIPLLSPSPRAIEGLETVQSPHKGSAIVEFDFDVALPLPGTAPIPPEVTNDAHEGVRLNQQGIEQVDRFFNPGSSIEHTCDGPCDPS